jgi:hypothetical protein
VIHPSKPLSTFSLPWKPQISEWISSYYLHSVLLQLKFGKHSVIIADIKAEIVQQNESNLFLMAVPIPLSAYSKHGRRRRTFWIKIITYIREALKILHINLPFYQRKALQKTKTAHVQTFIRDDAVFEISDTSNFIEASLLCQYVGLIYW